MWFEPISTWLVALVTTGIPWLNEKTTKTIPDEYWANKELRHKDIMDGVSSKEMLRRAELGRYYIPEEITQAYPVPHRDPDEIRHRIIIENCELYYEDASQHGAHQAQKWVSQGKYNLTPEELKLANLKRERDYQYRCSLSSSDSKYIEKTRSIDRILEIKHWDYRNTEAVRQWQKAHDAESKYY